MLSKLRANEEMKSILYDLTYIIFFFKKEMRFLLSYTLSQSPKLISCT